MSTVVVLGGTGLFGGLLVGDLIARTDLEVLVSTRSGIPDDQWPPGVEGRVHDERVDASDLGALVRLIEEVQPSVLVHAAGPYLRIGDAPLRAALQTQTHYVDLCPRSQRYETLRDSYGDAAAKSGKTFLVGTSTVGGITGTMTRHAVDQMDSVDRVRTALAVHNFGWGPGLVADYLLSVDWPVPAGPVGSSPQRVHFPDGSSCMVALGDTMEHVHSPGLIADTEHRFGLDSPLPRWGMRAAERLSRLGVPMWRGARIFGQMAGLLGGHRTEGGLLHQAFGTMDGQAGVLETFVRRPFGNVRNPSVLAALAAADLAAGIDLGSGFVHPASWIEPTRLIDELRARANDVEIAWRPA